MPDSPSSRSPEKRRFQGQGTGDHLAKLLESGSGEGGARIKTLIKSINRMKSLVLELRQKDLREEVDYAMELSEESSPRAREKTRRELVRTLQKRQSGWPPSDEIEELRESINNQLSFYVGGVLILGTFDEAGYAVFPLVRGKSKAGAREWGALDSVLWLSRKGLLHRIRKCDHVPCGRWFYARFDHQLSCSGKCRIQKYRSSPEFKERKNRLQREYYQLEKRRARRAINDAQRRK